MYKRHKVFELPEPATQIWRYLGFTKLVALLSTNALHFTRADQLSSLMCVVVCVCPFVIG